MCAPHNRSVVVASEVSSVFFNLSSPNSSFCMFIASVTPSVYRKRQSPCPAKTYETLFITTSIPLSPTSYGRICTKPTSNCTKRTFVSPVLTLFRLHCIIKSTCQMTSAFEIMILFLYSLNCRYGTSLYTFSAAIT